MCAHFAKCIRALGRVRLVWRWRNHRAKACARSPISRPCVWRVAASPISPKSDLMPGSCSKMGVVLENHWALFQTLPYPPVSRDFSSVTDLGSPSGSTRLQITWLRLDFPRLRKNRFGRVCWSLCTLFLHNWPAHDNLPIARRFVGVNFESENFANSRLKMRLFWQLEESFIAISGGTK